MIQDGTRLAAVDLGSNSFRLEIGRIEHGQYCRTEYLKETVRQGSGLDAERNLSTDVMQRGWDCLARFGERLAGFKTGQVRAVATQTLREAHNRDQFLLRAEAVLGFPIDVIAGREEARLIYQGVAQTLPQSDERRLVIDIGGRSTELILGHGLRPTQMESFRVGSSAWSTRFFPAQQFSKHAFAAAEIAAKAVLDEALNAYPRKAWDAAYGSAGTVGAVGDMLALAGWPSGLVSRDGLDWLLKELISAQSADRVRLAGLKEDRRAVIGGGVSVLRAVFDLLQIDQMQLASGSLRHGLLFDLMGLQPGPADVRVQSVKALAARFGADPVHGQRVGQVAVQLLTQLQGPESLQAPSSHQRLHRKLGWAAQLHEIGSQISHSEYHKHGAYILEHADVMGFAVSELHTLSLLVLGHRGKLRKLEADFEDEPFIQQLLALRLAVILCHARRDPDLNGLRLSRQQHDFSLRCRAGWAQSFPQSAYLLQEEASAWKKTPWSLTVSGC